MQSLSGTSIAGILLIIATLKVICAKHLMAANDKEMVPMAKLMTMIVEILNFVLSVGASIVAVPAAA